MHGVNIRTFGFCCDIILLNILNNIIKFLQKIGWIWWIILIIISSILILMSNKCGVGWDELGFCGVGWGLAKTQGAGQGQGYTMELGSNLGG